MQSEEIFDLVRNAVSGLLFPSESDFPLVPFVWKLPDEGFSGAENIDVVEFDQFFSGVCDEQEWFGEEERQIAARFRKLANLLKEHLTELQVFRVGITDIDVFVVGKADDGNFVGMKTHLVET